MYEALIYGDIWEWSAKNIIQGVIDAKPKDITVRVNSNGGEVRYGWGVLTKILECKGKKIFKNDGEANSMGAFAFCYADEAEAVDTANFGFHRAAYAQWIENNPEYFTEGDRQYLENINAKLREALVAKVDVPVFEKITGCTIDELFSMEGRREVVLTAEQAKQCKLIDRIVQITPQKKAEIEAKKAEIMAKHIGHKVAAKTQNSPTPNKMDIQELKAQHPGVYAQVFELGRTEGASVERDRVEAALVFAETDLTKVKEIIASGKPMTSKDTAELTLKAVSAQKVANVEEDSAKQVVTAEADKKTEPTDKEKFLAEAKKHSHFFNTQNA